MEEGNELVKERRRKLSEIRELGINPYPYKFEKTHDSDQIIKKHDSIKADERTGEKVSVAGRLMSLRNLGKIAFSHLQDGEGRIQIVFRKDVLSDYKLLKKLDVGDIVGVKGEVFKTRKGELSVEAAEFMLLSKSLRPLPEKYHGMKDQELRYRKRYLDMTMNPEVREIIRKRSRMLKEIRRFLDERGYLEIETPILQPIYGGASARPFTTHHNSLDATFYLRISDELYLKRLIAGGFEKVFEIGKNFRNEGIDQTHNPEFTMIEWYSAYEDLYDMMEITESLIKDLANKVTGGTKLSFRGHDIDVGKPFGKIPMIDSIKEIGGHDIEKLSDDDLRKIIEKEGQDTKTMDSRGALINEMFELFVEEKLIQPTFITDYPKEICPLTKDHREKKGLVERFELFIGGKEFANAYSELTDPDEQRQRLMEQEKRRDIDDESMRMDEDFIEAMEYGMPPMGGVGIGVDRLAMLITGNESIKDVIAFPTLRPES
jgi:lysyl-tRNA synthetase class 2